MLTENIKILLVEDNPGDAWLVQKMLADINANQFDVMHCTCLDQAVQNLKQHNIDVVLLDLTLPDAQKLDSLTLLNNMFPNIPIVVFSGLNDESLALEAVQNGTQDYLARGKGTEIYLHGR